MRVAAVGGDDLEDGGGCFEQNLRVDASKPGANFSCWLIPAVPAIIGVILGPAAEGKLRQSLQISNGDWSILWSSGFSIGVYIAIVLILVAVGARAIIVRQGSRSAA